MSADDKDFGPVLCVLGGVSALGFTVMVTLLGIYGVSGEGGPVGAPGDHHWHETVAYVLMSVTMGGVSVFLLTVAWRRWRGSGDRAE